MSKARGKPRPERRKKALDKRAAKFLRGCFKRYKHNPDLFAKEVLGVELSEHQQKPALMALANGKRNIAVRSGHGTGKSCMAAVAILWFLCTRKFPRVIITAPSSNQLYNTMMSEVKKWYNQSILEKLNLFYFTKDKIRFNHSKHSNNWFASAVSVANPENISGTHAYSVLAVVDEGAGVETPIFERLEGVLTTPDCCMMTQGNPSFDSGYFYDIFHKEDYSEKYDLFKFSCLDSPNVDYGWVQMMKEKYGEDSNVYKVRVLGEFAPMDEEVVIRREEVKNAIGRIVAYPSFSETVHFGIDVSTGDSNDYSVICIRKGNMELQREKYKVKLSELREITEKLIGDYLMEAPKIVVNIDTTGIGYQFGQDLEETFWRDNRVEINRVNFSYKAEMFEVFGNIVTEMFFNMNEIIKEISLLNIKGSTLEEDLGARKYWFTETGQFKVERKREFIKRFNRSPDEGDAVLLAFYDASDLGKLKTAYIGARGV